MGGTAKAVLVFRCPCRNDKKNKHIFSVTLKPCRSPRGESAQRTTARGGNSQPVASDLLPWYHPTVPASRRDSRKWREMGDLRSTCGVAQACCFNDARGGILVSPMPPSLVVFPSSRSLVVPSRVVGLRFHCCCRGDLTKKMYGGERTTNTAR